MFARVRRGFSLAAKGAGYLALGLVVGNVTLSYRRAQEELSKPLPKSTVLKMDLRHGSVKEKPTKFGNLLSRHRITTKELVEALEYAENDDRLQGLLLLVGPSTFNLAQAQEVREGIRRLKEKGKFTIAYAEDFSSQVAYYLATACDKVYVEPAGSVGLCGFHTEQPFVKNLLDKLDIEPEMYGMHEYKNIVNIVTESDFTPAHKESLQSLLESCWSQIMEGISADRKIKREDLEELVNAGPFTPKEALAAKLVDKALPYSSVLFKAVKEAKGESALFLAPDAYCTKRDFEEAKKTKKPLSKQIGEAFARRGETDEERAKRIAKEKKPVIAVVYALGEIHTGPSKEGITAHRMQKALRQASQDPHVKAVVLRVDSPGGSALASDLIYNALREVTYAGKPLIASMGGVAASGGYYISAAADKILAEPGTITGSIGVAGGKMVFGKLANNIGVTFGEIKIGENAAMYSALRPFSPTEFRKFYSHMQDTYTRFVGLVAYRRNFDYQHANDIARGRVWTGEQALKRGLVDEIGGLRRAVQIAKEKANIAADTKPIIKIFPERKWHKDFLDEVLADEPVADSHVHMHALSLMIASSPIIRSVAASLMSMAGASGMHAAAGMSLGKGLVPSGPLAQPSMAQNVSVTLPEPFRYITFF